MLLALNIAAVVLGAVGCAPSVGDAPPGEPAPFRPLGLTDCPRPDEGCACEAGAASVECYVDPSESPDGATCGVGVRYCRDGVWTACQDVRFVTIRTGLIAPGFNQCDVEASGALGCNPDCFIASDSPDPWDLDDSNSDEHVHRSTVVTDPPGVYLEIPPASVLVDTDGDGFHDVGENPECVGQTPATVDGAGVFGCPGGDGMAVYAEIPPGASSVTTLPVLPLPPPPLDVYVLADLSVLEFDNPLYPFIGPSTIRLTLDEPFQDLADNAAAFAAAIEAPIVAAGFTPDVRYGIGYFHDYQALSHYGDPWGRALAYRHHHDLDPDVAAFATAMDAMSPALEAWGFGNLWDWKIDFSLVPFELELISPESHTQALYSIATGAGLPFGASPIPAGPACPAGTWGYPCFRDEAIPVVALVMDGAMHNGPGAPGPIGRYPYELDYAPLASLPAATPSGSVTGFGGAGTYGNPWQLPGDAATSWRSFSGSTASGSGRNDSVSSDPCGSSNWDAHDETSRFTVGSAARITIRLEKGAWSGRMRAALVNDATGAVVACADASGTILWQVNLAAGTYRVRVDGGESGGVFGIGAYHDRGTYTLSLGAAPDWRIGYQSHVLPALVSNGIKVVGLNGCSLGTFFSYDCLAISEARSQLFTLASDTGAVDVNGNAIVRDVTGGGGGAATTALADAIGSLATDIAQTIRFIPRDDPSTGVVDERAFVASLSVTPPGCFGGSCSPDFSNPGGTKCTPCTSRDGLELSVNLFYDPANPAHPPPLPTPQVFDFDIDVVSTRGGADVVLRTIPVRVVIPPVVMLEPGTYWRDYDATVFDPSLPAGTPLCEIGGITGLRPDWSTLRWDAVTPANDSGASYVEIRVGTADDPASLVSASDFCFRIPETAPAAAGCPAYPASGAMALLDVGAEIVASGGTNYRHLLRATATLYPTPDAAIGPTLHEMALEYVCTPIE